MGAIRVILFNDLPVTEEKESLVADPTMPALPAVRNQLLSVPDLLRSLVEQTVNAILSEDADAASTPAPFRERMPSGLGIAEATSIPDALLATATTPAPIVNVSPADTGWLAPTVLMSGLASLVALLVALLLPWWRDRHERAKRPHLSLQADKVVVEQAEIDTGIGDGAVGPVPWARLSIHNDGVRSAAGATAFVLSWTTLGGRHEDLGAPLKITHEGGSEVTVHPGMPRLVDFAWKQLASTTSDVTLLVAPKIVGSRHVIELPLDRTSEFEVRLRVVAEGADPADYVVKLWSSGAWGVPDLDTSKLLRIESIARV